MSCPTERQNPGKKSLTREDLLDQGTRENTGQESIQRAVTELGLLSPRNSEPGLEHLCDSEDGKGLQWL